MALPAVVQAQFYTTTNNGKITIKGYNGSGAVVTIPSTINGLPVTSIGSSGFYLHGNLTTVIIPSSVTDIEATAFQSCSKLTHVVIPDSVTNIGFGAFSGCHDLTAINVPKGVIGIGQVAFSSCINLAAINVDPANPKYSSVDGVLFNKDKTSLIEYPGGKNGAYTVPDSVTTIEDNAFSELRYLTSVTIPDHVTTIEWHAFMSCILLTNVMIGSGVTSIGDDDSGWLPFNGCSKLMMITVNPLNRSFSSVDGVLLNKSKTKLIKYPEGKIESYDVPAGVAVIGSHAFSGATHLTSVTIPDSVINIEDYAFENCNALTNVMIGKGVTSIADGAFHSWNNTAVAFMVDEQNPIYGSKDGAIFDKRKVKATAALVGAISIKEPANNASINAMWVDVHGTFTAKNPKQITIGSASANMEMPADITGNTFEARNVFLGQGTNTIVAVIKDVAGNMGTNSIIIIGPTDTNTAQTFPVQIQTSTSSGFGPLTVVLTAQSHVPGKIQKVIYDFDGDNIPDQTNSDLQPVTHIYKTSREYYPIITIQTTVGRFSSLSGMFGMLAAAFGNSDAVAVVNVQSPPVLLSTIKITDPVDIKWTATSNLYVLSGSTATITEFDANGKLLRSIKGIGTNPSGFDVDKDGNVYVAVTGDNQVKKFKPTADSFESDAPFGNGGLIGNKDGSAGSNQLNAPFDVKLSRDGQAIIVSDSGNQQVRQFTIDGKPRPEEGGSSSLHSPKGLALDELGIYLFIVDSGNNRIILTSDFMQIGISGTNGSGLGQFNGATHLSANERALYVADTGNNRVQIFNHVEGGEMHSPTPFNPRIALSSEFGLNHPKSVAAVDDLLQEKIYIADTGNNRVILVKLPSDNPEAVWKDLIARLKAGNTSGILSDFSIASKDKYQDAFTDLSKNERLSMVKDMENIKPVYVNGDRAQYYFESVVEGHTLTFPVEFDKEFGQWKIMEY